MYELIELWTKDIHVHISFRITKLSKIMLAGSNYVLVPSHHCEIIVTHLKIRYLWLKPTRTAVMIVIVGVQHDI